jgi:hypothetical protein
VKQKPIETLLIFSAIFNSSITFFNEPFEGYFHYLIFILFFPFFIFRYGFPSLPIKLVLLPLLSGIFYVIIGDNTIDLFLKIFIGVVLSTSFYFYVFRHYEMDVDRLYRLFLKGCVFASWVGIVQWISFRIGFSPGYDYGWLLNKWAVIANNSGGIRINSFFAEPSQCSIVLIPAVFVAFNSLMTWDFKYLTKIECFLVIIVVLFTFSSTGYIGFFVIALLLMANYGQLTNFFAGIILVSVFAVIIFTYVPEVHSRVNSSIGLWVDEDLSVKNVNSSSFVLFNNFHIAFENFKGHFLMGTGLGSHKIAFAKYSLTRNTGILNFAFNQGDANSLFLRLMSETGLMGLVFIFGVIFKCYVRRSKDREGNSAWIISNSILVMIILCLIRQGNYFLNGFPFFVWLYYYNYVVFKDRMDDPVLIPQPIE